jgi:hypothetical protein
MAPMLVEARSTVRDCHWRRRGMARIMRKRLSSNWRGDFRQLVRKSNYLGKSTHGMGEYIYSAKNINNSYNLEPLLRISFMSCGYSLELIISWHLSNVVLVVNRC